MKKRLLFLVTLLVAWASAISLNAQEGYVDVTSQYLTDPGFESCTVTSSNAPAGASAAPLNIGGEWTQVESAAWSSSAVVAYGGSGQVNGVSAPAYDNLSNSGKTLGVSVGWGGTVTYQSGSFTLPAGSYVIKIQGYNALSGTTQFKSLFGFIPTSGTSIMSSKTSFTSGSWDSDEISITLTQPTIGKIQVGGQAISGGSGSNAKVFFDNIVILYSGPATSDQMQTLGALITSNDNKTLGFEAGEYAPYNNVAAINALTEAKAVDLDQPDNYSAADINSLISSLQNATWTANAAEVNAVYWKTDYVEADKDAAGRIFPVGWTGPDNNSSYQTRVMCPISSTNTGITGDNKTAIFTKLNATYGENLGYTMPLKADTYYEIKFKYCGWGNNPTTNVVMTGPDGTVTVTPGSFKPATSDGDANLEHWYDYVAVFKTESTAGDYTIAFNKVETGQQQIAWTNMTILKATDASDFPALTVPEGQMNVDVKQQLNQAQASFDANKSIENYENLYSKIQDANASIATYSKIKNYLDNLATTTQLGGISVEDFQASSVYTKYNDGSIEGTGTYISLDEMIAAYKNFVANYWSTNTPEANSDLTAFVLNQGFEIGEINTTGIDCWNVTQHNGGNYIQTEGDNRVANLWANYDTTVTLSQTIEGLPNGTYEVYVSVKSSNPDINLQMNGDDHILTGHNADNFTDIHTMVSVLDGTIEFALSSTKTSGYNAYFRADNVRLKYLSDEYLVKPGIPEEQMNAQVKEAMLAAEAAYDADPSSDNLKALIQTIVNANASITTYEKINNYLNNLEAQLGVISSDDFRNASVYTKYSDGQVNETADATTGTYTSLDEVISQFRTFVAEYWTNHTPTDNANMNAFIVNNGFEFGDLTGWTLPNGASGGDGSIVVSTHERGPETASEGTYYFHSWWTGVALQQAISGLPNGQYRLTATVSSNDTNDEHTVFIYADNDNLGVNVPANSMTTWQSPATFDFNVVDGNLTIGVVGGKQDNTFDVNNPWIFYNADNFQLTYLSSSLIKPEIPSGPMNKDVLAALTAADAAFDATGGNTPENYAALVTAINNANASIAVYQQINAVIPKLEAQKGSVDVAALTTDYVAGEYVTLNDVYTKYHNIVKDALANPGADTDMTPFIINPSFEFGNTTGWTFTAFNDSGVKSTTEGTTYPYSGTDGSYLFNTWSYNNTQTVNLSQTLSDLPNGTYKLTAMLSGYASRNITMTAGTESSVTTTTENGPADGVNGELTFVVSNGQITFRVETEQFFKADNFQLTFLSSAVAQEFQDEVNGEIDGIDETKPMNRVEKEAYVAAKAAWDVDPSPANYAKVKAAAEVAKKSIASYEIAAADFHEVLNATTKTNIYTYDAYNKYMAQYHRYYEQYETGGLSDTDAQTIRYVFFGNRTWHQPGLPIVQLLGSAWDDRGDDTWDDEIIVDYKPLVREAGNGNNYWINTWSGEGDNDGSDFIVPFMEYWVAETETLADDVLTASVAAATGTRYTVTGVLRARVAGGAEPTGITMQIISEEQVDATLTPTWERVGDSEYYIANVSITGSTDVIDNNQDGLNDLHIQFVVNETNANWFSFKDLFAQRETPLDAATVEAFVNQMTQAVADVANYPLGFEEGEYAPYNNAKKLKAAEICQNFIDQITEAGQSGAPIPNYMMMQQAYSALANSGEWVQNTCEQNAFYWTTDYSADDVEVVTWYNEDGTISQRWDGYVNQFRTCYPVGWTLGDRADAYNSRIIKFGIDDNNAGSASEQGTMPGLKSAADGTVLFTKQDTHYGEETGYTLPLKAGKKYYLSFIYADHDEGKMPTTNIVIRRRSDASQVVTDLTYNSFAPAETQGNYYQDRWYYYRGTFTVPATGNYVVEFNKERNDGRTWGEQRQTAIGDLVLVLAPENDDMIDAIAIDGQCTDFNAADQTPAFDFNPAEVTLTRAFNGNGETGTWNTIMVPFNLDWAETKKNFGIEEIAYYTGTEDTDIGIRLLFETRRTGLKANQPVMVFYKADNEKLNLSNATMLTRTSLASNNTEDQFGTTYKPVVIGKSTNDGIEKDDESRFVIYDPNGKFDFVGTYQTIHIPYYGVYINKTNEWKQSTGQTGLQPTRAYFREVSGDGTNTAKLLGFSIDDMPTGIIAIDEDGEMHVTSGNIYTIDGRLVRQNATGLEGLEPGIYVVDGKKYIIK